MNEKNVATDTRRADVVDQALAEALSRAATAGMWEVVTQLARELEARRKAHQAPGVIDLEAERAKRERPR